MDNEAHIIKKKHVGDDTPYYCKWCSRTYHETIPAFFDEDYCSEDCKRRSDERYQEKQLQYSIQGQQRSSYESNINGFGSRSQRWR
jgi:hypothetical protein